MYRYIPPACYDQHSQEQVILLSSVLLHLHPGAISVPLFGEAALLHNDSGSISPSLAHLPRSELLTSPALRMALFLAPGKLCFLGSLHLASHRVLHCLPSFLIS